MIGSCGVAATSPAGFAISALGVPEGDELRVLLQEVDVDTLRRKLQDITASRNKCASRFGSSYGWNRWEKGILLAKSRAFKA